MNKKQTKHKEKQSIDTEQQAFDLKILNAKSPEIRKLKKLYPTSIHGNKFWGSSFLLMDHFRKHPIASNVKALELGCGWALASIYLNKRYLTEMHCIDADSDVFAYANLHAHINQATIQTLQKRFEKITKSELAQYEVIIAADVCFWDELTAIHFNLIRRALKAGVKKIVYADPERSPFTDLYERCLEQLKEENVSVSIEDARVKSLKASGKLLIIEKHQ